MIDKKPIWGRCPSCSSKFQLYYVSFMQGGMFSIDWVYEGTCGCGQHLKMFVNSTTLDKGFGSESKPLTIRWSHFLSAMTTDMKPASDKQVLRSMARKNRKLIKKLKSVRTLLNIRSTQRRKWKRKHDRLLAAETSEIDGLVTDKGVGQVKAESTYYNNIVKVVTKLPVGQRVRVLIIPIKE